MNRDGVGDAIGERSHPLPEVTVRPSLSEGGVALRKMELLPVCLLLAKTGLGAQNSGWNMVMLASGCSGGSKHDQIA